MQSSPPQGPLAAGQSFLTAVGTCLIVTIPHFLRHAAPSLRHNLDVDRVVKSLRASRPSASPQKAITKQGRWKGFAKDPKRAKRAERDSFGNLAAAVKEIVKASKLADKDIHPFLQFENNAHCEPSCPSRDKDTLPDAFLYHGSSPSWRSIAVCGEHQKDDEEYEVDNVSLLPTLSFRRKI